jgi:hypothetical protein
MATTMDQQRLRIKYSGPCREDANALASELGRGQVIEPERAAEDTSRFAIGEIVLTVILSSAAKAAVDVLIERLRTYLEKRIQKGEASKTRAPNLKVVLEGHDGGRSERRIALRVATIDLVAKFLQNVGEDATKAMG